MRKKLANEEIGEVRLPRCSLVLRIQCRRAILLADARELAWLVAPQPPNLLVHGLDVTLFTSTCSSISNPCQARSARRASRFTD